MADKKISELPLLNSVSGSSLVIPIVHDGTTVKVNLSQLGHYASQWSAKTGSANTFTGTQSIIGNVNISGKLSVNSIEAVYETSSILYTSGSTQIGDQSTDVHTIFGTVNLNGLALGTNELMAQTASQAAVNLGISSTTGSINTTTSSFNSEFIKIGSTTSSIHFTTQSLNTQTGSQNSLNAQIGIATGSLNAFTQSLNSLSGSFATTGSNTFRGNQAITGSLSVSAGEFNVITGSGNMTSSLIFDHTQNDGVTLGLRHNDRLSLADHTFNVQVWASGVYTTFVRNGTPYSVLNVEAFDDNKIYLYRDTRLYNKSLVIDNNLTVQNEVVIGSGSLSIQRGQFNAVTGSGALTSSLSFTHTTVDPITGNGTLELRYRNNQVGSENNAWKFVATDNGVQVRYDQYTTSNKMLFSVSSFGSNFDKLLIWRDVRLFGTGLTVDDSLLVKGVITGSILATNGVVSSSNQLFELNAFTGSVIGQTNTIAAFTSSVNFTTQSLNTQTGSQDLVNRGISSVTGSINTTTSSFNSVFSQIGSTTSSLIGITNGLMAFTAALDSTYATDAQLYQLYQATSSIHSTTQSLNVQTGSQQNLNSQIGIATSSLNSVSASLIGITNGLMAFTAALDSTYATDAQLYQLYQATASIHFATSSLNTFSGSIRSEVNLLESYTASLKAAAIVSSSTQISNYYKFAETASANTFYGTQTINGNLQLSSTSPLVYNAGNTNAMLFGFFDGSSIYGPYYQIFGSNYSNVSQRGSAEFVFDSRNGGYSGFNIAEFNGSTWLRKFRVSPSGAEVTGSFVVDGGITGSLMATNNVVSSSTQIQNYFLFAQTASANTVFYGNVTASGNLHANQLYIGGATTASGLFGASEAVVQNELGIQYGDATGTYMRIIANTANSNTAIVAGAFTGVAPQLDLIVGSSVTAISVKNDGGVNLNNAITASYYKVNNGGGIDFSAGGNAAGMTSELLNDYEEGTWTPTVTVVGTNGTINYIDRSGRYTKIGRLVNVEYSIIGCSLTGSNGYLKITGLPFTINSTNAPYQAFAVYGNLNFPSSSILYQQGGISDTVIYPQVLNNSGFYADFTQANLNSGGRFTVSAGYVFTT